jgi:hypothetical protein
MSRTPLIKSYNRKRGCYFKRRINMEKYELEEHLRTASSCSDIVGVYWSSRDMDTLFVGNHHFFTFVYADEAQAKRVTKRWLGWEELDYCYEMNDAGLIIFYTTVGVAKEEGNIIFSFNPDSDQWSINEIAKKRNTEPMSVDKDFQSCRIPHNQGGVNFSSYEELMYAILHKIFNFNKNLQSGISIEYVPYDENCACGVNSVLRQIGYSTSIREEMGEFWGLDWGEEDLLDAKYFTLSFIGNNRSHELHVPSCKSAEKILPENQTPFMNVYDALDKGYNGCFECMNELDTDKLNTLDAYYKLHLISVKCNETEDITGSDDVYIAVDGRRIWGPVKMNNSDVQDLRTVPPVRFKRDSLFAVITLYDQDSNWQIVSDVLTLDKDDMLDSVSRPFTDAGSGELKCSFSGDGASYEITYRVVAYDSRTDQPFKSSFYDLSFISIKCNETEDITGADKTYITANGNVIWGPKSMNNGYIKNLTGVLPYLFESKVELSVYDQDSSIPSDDDDCLGTNTVTAEDVDKGELTLRFTKDDANYEIKYKVTPHDVVDKRTLHLVKIKCVETEDITGPDDVYLHVNGALVWGPLRMNNGEERNMENILPYTFFEGVSLDLYDLDEGIPFDDDDHLGNVIITADEVGKGELTCSFKSDGAKYKLTYRVEN